MKPMVKECLTRSVNLMTCVLVMSLAVSATAHADVVINEIDYDQPGTDTAEFIELFNNGSAPHDLTGYTLELVNGNGASVYASIGLPTQMLASGAYYVVCKDATVTPNCDQEESSLSLQNGAPDAVALMYNQVIMDAVSYEGDVVGYVEGSGVNPADDNTTAELGLSRYPNGQDSNDNAADFSPRCITPGAATTDVATNCVAPTAVSSLIINEVDADTPGTADDAEFVELRGEPNASLDGYVLVFYNGNGDSNYAFYDLAGQSLNGLGYFVLCGDALNVANCDMDVNPNTGLLQNGADAVALYQDSLETFAGNAALTTTNLVDALVYGTSDPEDTGLLELLNAGQSQVDENALNAAEAQSNQRCGDGLARDTQGYQQATPTPGADNLCDGNTTPPPSSLFGSCGEQATPINVIQGSEADSPLVGIQRTVEAVVVADYQANDELKGFFLQSLAVDDDNDPTTSEGIFIYDNGFGVDVNEGDVVRVRGTITEAFGLTELNNISDMSVCSSANSITATELVMPFADAQALEAYEGMKVTLSQELTVTDVFNLGRFGEFSVSAGGRLFIPTAVVAPGPDALNLQSENDLNKLLVDDGMGGSNPDPVRFPEPGLSMDNPLRVGYGITRLSGVISYAFGNYRLVPTMEPLVHPINPRTDAPVLDAMGDLKVVSFNLGNYFNGDGLGGGFPTARGASNSMEYDRQREKLLNALTAAGADIIGLQELENDGYGANSAIRDLTDGLNEFAPAGASYEFVDPGVSRIGSDEIAVGLIYRVETVSPLNGAQILDDSVDPGFNDAFNRPSLAQSFRQTANNEVLTVVVNHLKSKGSSCDAVNDPDAGDGQGNCNLTRQGAAESLVNWLAQDPTGSNDPDVLLLGDFNSYAKEDPVNAILAGGYVDLIASLSQEQVYSTVFQGQSGNLDYAFVSDSLQPLVVSSTVWHINADEPRVFDYNEESKSASQINSFYSAEPYRSSDHDMVVVSLDLTGQTPTGSGNGGNQGNGNQGPGDGNDDGSDSSDGRRGGGDRDDDHDEFDEEFDEDGIGFFHWGWMLLVGLVLMTRRRPLF